MGKAVFTGLSHICIFVENVEKAIQYYKRILGAVPKQYIPHFRNPGFFEAGGFLKEAGDADVSIGIMEVPGAGLVLELMCYHYPKGRQTPMFFRANDISGARYIALKVANIEEAFEYIKSQSDVTLINTSEEYRVFKISKVEPSQIKFFDPEKENNPYIKQEAADILGNTKYFYFVDRYGLQWEYEQENVDICDLG